LNNFTTNYLRTNLNFIFVSVSSTFKFYLSSFSSSKVECEQGPTAKVVSPHNAELLYFVLNAKPQK